MQNRVTLDQIGEMEIGALAKLPLDQLKMLIDDADMAVKDAQKTRKWLDGALEVKYGKRAAGARQLQSKAFGIIRLDDPDSDEFEIKVNQDKQVEWDQLGLASAREVIRNKWKEDPCEYIDAKFTVSETKWKAWPSTVQRLFEESRTVKPRGKPKYEIVPATRNQEAA